MKAKNIFLFNGAIVTLLWTFIFLFANLIFAQKNIVRIDFTRSSKYSLSPYSRKVLGKLEHPIKITYYLSRELPEELRGLRRYSEDLLQEYKAYSRGKLEVEWMDPVGEKDGSDSNNKGYGHGITEDVKKAYAKKGIPLSLKEGKAKSFYYFSSIHIKYTGKERVVDHIQEAQNLEYRLTSALDKLLSVSASKVGFYATGSISLDLKNKEFGSFIEQVNNLHAIQKLNLDKNAPVPDDVKILVIFVQSKISEAAAYQIDQFLSRGGKAIFLTQVFDPQKQVIDLRIPFKDYWQMPPQYRQQLINAYRSQLQATMYYEKTDLGIENLLAHYGIRLDANVLTDSGSCMKIEEESYSMGWIREVKEKKEKYFPELVSVLPQNCNREYSFVSNLENLVLVVPHSVSSTGKYKFIPLFTTTEKLKSYNYEKKDIYEETNQLTGKGKREGVEVLSVNDLNSIPRDGSYSGRNEKKAMAAMVQGKFTPFYTNPPWEKKEKTAATPSSKDGTIVVIGNILFLSQAFSETLKYRFQVKEPPAPRLLVELVEWMDSGTDLTEMRAKHFESQPLRNLTAGEKNWWRLIISLSMPSVVIFLGLVSLLVRRQTVYGD